MRIGFLVTGLVALSAVACGGEDGNGTSSGSGGSGLASSTGGSGGLGGGADATTRVEVMDEIGEPVSGVAVFVHDAAGAVISETASDAQGVVDLPLEAGQLLSVAWDAHETSEMHRVDTVPVTPGRDLRFTVARSKERIDVDVTFDVTGSSVWTSWSCSPNPGTPVQSGVVSVCPGSETFDAIVYVDGDMQAFPDQPSNDGMSFTFTVDPTQLQPAPSINVTATDSPADTSIGGSLYAYRPGGGYNWIAGGDLLRRVYAPPGSFIEETGALTRAGWQYRQIRWRDTVPNDITIDPFTLADLEGTAISGGATPTVTWSLASGDVGDAVRADVRWGWTDTPNSYKLLWRVYASPEAGTITFPELPIELIANPTLGEPEEVRVHHLAVDAADGVTAAANVRSDRGDHQRITHYLP